MDGRQLVWLEANGNFHLASNERMAHRSDLDGRLGFGFGFVRAGSKTERVAATPVSAGEAERGGAEEGESRRGRRAADG